MQRYFIKGGKRLCPYVNQRAFSSTKKQLPLKTVEEKSTELLCKHGVPRKAAEQVAAVLVGAEARGHASHGLLRLDRLITGIQAGTHFPEAQPTIQRTGSWLVVDGHHSLGPAVCTDVTESCIEIAKESGVAVASLRNITHFGIGGYYTDLAAEQGLCGLALCNTEPAASPFGGKGKVLGTNPISFSSPRKNGPPICVDLATTAAARGKLLAAQRDGATLPDYIAIDTDGNMTNDPTEGLKGGLSPLGGPFGYKGTGLGILVDILSGCLANAATATNVTGTATTTEMNTAGTFLMFLNPAVSCGSLDVFVNMVETLIGDLQAAGDSVLLPGQREREILAQSQASGIHLTPAVEEMFTRLG